VPRKSGRLTDVAGSLMEYVTTIYIFYFYLIGIEVIPSFTIIAIVSLYIHSLYRRLTILISTTLLFSN
jgi:hypothetical protein